LISLGLAENRDEVEHLISSVDIDSNGQIEFNEFLLLLKGEPANCKMQQFFKKLI
jgi:Ca2+-binding EF-hand superfamily protein